MNLKNTMNMFVILIILILSTCGSSSVKTVSKPKKDNADVKVNPREKGILKHYTDTKKEKYAGLIVNIKKYTTNGSKYQKKYYRYLIGIAGDITENKKLIIVKNSIGFYFDRKSHFKNQLYLGLDIDTGSKGSKNYAPRAIELLKSNLPKAIDTVNSCKTIFAERDVIGMVIGFRWVSGSNKELVSIWINEKDIRKFEKKGITFNELIERSTITGTYGKIIKLPI